jgi:hypothetical protein
MVRNPMAHSEMRSLMPKEGPQGELRNKRRSIQVVLEQHGINRPDQMRDVTSEEWAEIRREVDIIEKLPNLTDADIENYFRDGAELRNSIADLISEKGKAGLEELKNTLPKKKVN